MDFATLLGLVAGVGIIGLAMVSGGELSTFVNVPGLLIVVGGTIAATLIKFPLRDALRSFPVALKNAFLSGTDSPRDLALEAHRLADIVRRSNLLALENETIDNIFLQKGLDLCVDGHPIGFVKDVLEHELELSIERLEVGEPMFRAMGDAAPAFGLVGTLVGLVQMLSNLDEPSALGPAMAVALLTTLYGALIANLIALPIADKLEINGRQERNNRRLIIDSVVGIREGQNPRALDEILKTYVSGSGRESLEDEFEEAVAGDE